MQKQVHYSFEVMETGKEVRVSGNTAEEAAANLMFAMSKEFMGNIPAGKIFGIIPISDLDLNTSN